MVTANPSAPVPGFTLIEVLVVVLVVSIIAGLALVQFGVSTNASASQRTAQRMVAQLDNLCQAAAFSGSARGLAMAKGSYAQRRLIQGQWLGMNVTGTDALAGPQEAFTALPEQVTLMMEHQGQRVDLPDEPPLTPQLICDAEGALTPFVALIEDATSRFQVTGKFNAELVLEPA